MEPAFGWVSLAPKALARARAQLSEQGQGVRDEVGFLLLHQRYADRFFPGTSVLHTRLRYALFVPWQFLEQAGKPLASAQDALKRAEIGLAKRLKDRGEHGVIGGLTWPQLADQPPSSTYWSALEAWGLLRRDGRNRVPNRGTVHARLSASRPTMDDEDRPLIEVEAPFVALPHPPKDWSAATPLSFNLRDEEREFLCERLSHIPAPEPLRHMSLLSQLVRHEIDPPSSLWDKAIIKLAGPDAAPLRRARAVAALAAIGRGVYSALVEDRREHLDGRETPRLHRAQLERLLKEHAARATSELTSANLHLVEDDIGVLTPRLRTLLAQTLDWVHEGATDPIALVGAYEAAEGRKGLRSRLPDTANARTRRAEWDASDHPVGYPLHYRWGSVRGLLSDLRGPRP